MILISYLDYLVHFNLEYRTVSHLVKIFWNYVDVKFRCSMVKFIFSVVKVAVVWVAGSFFKHNSKVPENLAEILDCRIQSFEKSILIKHIIYYCTFCFE